MLGGRDGELPVTRPDIAAQDEAPTTNHRLKVLLVGSDHAITQGIARALALANWAAPMIVAPVTSPPSESPLEAISMDPRDTGAWRRTFPGIDAVIHAGFGDAARMLAVATAIARAAADMPQQPRIVHLGSMTAYGSAQGLVDEETPLRGDLGHYSAAHAEADESMKRLKNAVRLRLGVEYGPGCIEWTARPARWLQAHRIGDIGTGGDGWCNLAYVDDVVEAAVRCLARPDLAGEAFNVADPDPPTWNEYLLRFGAALGAVPVARISESYLRLETRLFAPPLKVAELILGRLHQGRAWLPPPMPPAFLATARHRIRLDTSRTRARLALVPTPLDTGIRRSASWHLGH